MQTGSGHHCSPQLLCGKGHGNLIGFTLSNKTIPAAHDRLKYLRLRRFISQSDPDLANRSIDSLFHVDENVFPPKQAGDLLASDQLALVVDQVHQQLQRKALEAHRLPTPVELKVTEV